MNAVRAGRVAVMFLATACGRLGFEPVAGDGAHGADGASTDAPGSPDGGISCLADNFDDGVADGWTVVSGTWTVEAQLYSHDDITANRTMTVRAPVWGDVTLQVDGLLASDCPSCGDILRLVFRYVDANNWCSVFFSRYYQVVGVEQWRNGNRTVNEVASDPGVMTWHNLRAVVQGARVDVYLDNVPTTGWTLTDGTTTGQVGLSTDRAHAHFDTFTVTRCAP